MSAPVVRAENLSKRYRLGSAVQGRLTESLWGGVERSLRLVRATERAQHGSVWALQDVSFEIGAGEVVGFIGRNGAGKSTLLKILSRITEPTTGFAELEGRVGSLLEVGTGFHPDLTGRENVFLYGALLGMPKREVQRRFDEIVTFAEVEQFLDTPVKRYSSGMYMRLAFAVAAHLEPEILIVDEVLAVGDLAFQTKCLGRMEEAASGGRTVLFVSHNTSAITSLCQRAHLLDKGRIVASGSATEVVARYLAALEGDEQTPLAAREDRGGDGSVRVTSLEVTDADGRSAITSSSRLRVTLGFESAAPVRLPRFVVTVYDANRYYGVYRLDTDVEGGLPEVLPARGAVSCVTEPIRLTAGRCGLAFSLHRAGALADDVEFAASFDVHADDFFASGRMPSRLSVLGLLRHTWTLEDSDAFHASVG